VSHTYSLYVSLLADDYSGSGNPFVQDGVAATNNGTSAGPSVVYTTGATAGDLLWSVDFNTTSGCDGYNTTVASPFTEEENDGCEKSITSDAGVSSSLLANTAYTATYTAMNSSVSWIVATLGFKLGPASYSASLSESNVASDAIARAASFGRGASESNAASDTIGGQRALLRTDSESNTTSDAILRLASFGRAGSESNIASDAMARGASFFRSGTEALSAWDALGRTFGAVRGETEVLSTSDSLRRALAAVRGDMETLTFTDAIVGLCIHRPLPRHELTVPGRVKSGTAPVH
jgi:hypothetical protein